MRRRLFRIVELAGGGDASLRLLERLRRAVGALSAVSLRRRLVGHSAENYRVVVEGATALVIRDHTSGPPTWSGTASELDAIAESLGEGATGWKRGESDMDPQLLIARDTWPEFAAAIQRRGAASWVIERVGRRSPVRSIIRPHRALVRLDAGAHEQQLRLYEAVGDGHHQPFGRGLAVHMTIVERLPADIGLCHEEGVETEPPFPIDVVHTWVDGSDLLWRQRRARAAELRDPVIVDAATEERFRSRDEIRFSLRSVNTFMPWVRHRYLVTDRQVPEWLDMSSDLVTVVDHREIIDAEFLPTFNSHVIEACLHRIPGLSEHFVYFNDDVFVGRALGWRSFFDDEGRSRYFPSSVEVPNGLSIDSSIDAATVNGRRLVVERFGTDASNKMRHTAHPQRKAIHHWMDHEFPSERRRTMESRFRSAHDQSFAVFLHHYVGEQLGLAVRSMINYDYIGLNHAQLPFRLRGVLRRTDPFDMFCLNDGPVDADNSVDVEDVVVEFLEAAYPFPAPWERTPSIAGKEGRTSTL